MFSVFYTDSHIYALYAECHYAKWHYSECYYAESYYAESYYAESYYAECHYAECDVLLNVIRQSIVVPFTRKFQLIL